MLRAAILTLLMLLCAATQAAVFVVNTQIDSDDGNCTAGHCSLREAINAANAGLRPLGDTINFNIAPLSGPQIPIDVLLGPLPTITGRVTINGYSEPGTSVNTATDLSNAVLRLRLNGGNFGANTPALAVCANNVTIKGLAIASTFGGGIVVGRDNSGAACPSAVTGARIVGNFLGLQANGTSGGSNNQFAVKFVAADGTIGDVALADRNVIAGSGSLIIIEQGATTVVNNVIGADKIGRDASSAAQGILLGAGAANSIIGTADAPNLIVFNTRGIATTAAGVTPATGNGNRFNFNHFSSNDQLGIDLNADGVTNNDLNDADNGPNNLQNFPVISSVARIAGGVHVNGSLDVPPSAPAIYQIGVYASVECDAFTNHGEGEMLLGVQAVSLSGSSETFSFDQLSPATIPFGGQITLTATAPNGSTSEFSTCAALDPAPLVVNSLNDVADGQCNAAHCSLREAIIAANSDADTDLISFNISTPASGELLIQLLTPLPQITQPVLIDGGLQPGSFPGLSILRIRVDGLNLPANAAVIDVCANGTTVRGLSLTSSRTNIDGLRVCAAAVSNVRIAGNFVGLRPDGSIAGNNAGISVSGTAIIGGELDGDENVIGANITGIRLQGSNSQVVGNVIGTNANGSAARGNTTGIFLQSGTANSVIGNATAPNSIRNSLIAGIATTSGASSGNRWIHNRIFDNAGLGMDLGNDGLTLNDVDDADVGANGLQNFPVLSSAERLAGSVRLYGTLDVPVGTTNQPYTIGVYASASCDPSGHGEAERLIGASVVNLTQTSAENFGFDLVTTDPMDPGTQITTTATAPDGSSSEFSACMPVTDPPVGLVVTSVFDTDGSSCGATCTLRQAINAANANPGPDEITFAIQGAGLHTITLTSSLPTVTEALIVDGYSQPGSQANNSLIGSDAQLMIKLRSDFTLFPSINAFSVCSSDVSIKGLVFDELATAVQTATSAGTVCNGAIGNIEVAGNFIGVDESGLNSGGMAAGVRINDAAARIGTATPGGRNVFGGMLLADISVNGAGSAGTEIVNNLIGVGADGLTDLGNIGHGILINGASQITIGGAGLAANVIRFNSTGVLVTGASAGNRISGNQIADNHALGIDLSLTTTPDGVSNNDPNDTDSGPNDLQNFPVLTAGSASTQSITLNGTLDVPATASNASYVLDFYENTACDANGHGEGAVPLASRNISLSGNAESFSVTLNVAPNPQPTVISATATDAAGNTSEFSACTPAPRPDALLADGFE